MRMPTSKFTVVVSCGGRGGRRMQMREASYVFIIFYFSSSFVSAQMAIILFS